MNEMRRDEMKWKLTDMKMKKKKKLAYLLLNIRI